MSEPARTLLGLRRYDARRTGSAREDREDAHPMEDLDPADPSVVGGYPLLARLGGGGMGQVYLSRTASGRPLAVKTIRAELGDEPGFEERFVREIRNSDRVRSPWTATVVDYSPAGARPQWLATEYVPAPSLGEWLERYGPLPEPALLSLAAELTGALRAVHGADMVHRDVKPSNVLLARERPRLIDFGVARAADDPRHTRTGGVIGSPGYLAPEQAVGTDVGAPADVFSLAAVVACAATGRGPFSPTGTGGSAAPALLYRIVHEEPDLAGVPEKLLPILRDCLAKDPAARPTADQLGERLERVGAVPGRWSEVCPPALEGEAEAREEPVRAFVETPTRVEVAETPTRVDVAEIPTRVEPTDMAATMVATPPARTAGGMPAGAVPGGAVPAGAVPVGAVPVGAVPGEAPADTEPVRRRRWIWPVLALAVVMAIMATTAVLLIARDRSDDRADDRPKKPRATSSSAAKVPAKVDGPADEDERTDPSDAPAPPGAGAPQEPAGPPEVLVVQAPRELTAGTFLESARAKLIMQVDGNLVVHDENGTVRWASMAMGEGNRALFQPDGNLVVYNAENSPVWASNTAGNDGANLILQANGDVVVGRENEPPLWAAGTGH
ncbi:protein kinase domain-containing protein [Streptomyces sp. NRRL F-5135]|uniref:protein kinase domain-containing protein n=1 Tax=Streptomyces sp. NRRL F-5135 TaxID=1463858 RepID=UPI00131A9BBE|nr:protein kinase [Streptomyces sp. NRRL F-5135]